MLVSIFNPQHLKPKQITRSIRRLMKSKRVLQCCKKRAQQAKQEDGIARASEHISCLLHEIKEGIYVNQARHI